MEKITTLELLKLLSALSKNNNGSPSNPSPNPSPAPADKEEKAPSAPSATANAETTEQKNTDLSSHREENQAYADFLKAHDERVRRIKK